MPPRLSHCPLCSGVRFHADEFATWYLNLAPPYQVAQCRDCTLRFLNPRPTADEYQRMYSDYSGPLAETYPASAEFYGSQDELRLREYRAKLARLARLGVRGGRLLELGSCTGVFLHEAQQAGFDVVGVEPSNAARETARERFGLVLCAGNIEDQDLAPASFDVVFSSHVFEHLFAPLDAARRVTAWLKPNGLHMLEVPNQFEQLGSRLRRWHLRPRFQLPRTFLSIHHTTFFSPRTLRRLVRESGCQPIHLRGIRYGDVRIFSQPTLFLKRAIGSVLGAAAAIEMLARKPPG